MELPIELWQIILDYSYFIEQINLTMVCKYFNNNLKIFDFLCNNTDSFSWSYDYDKINEKVTNDILKKYPYIKFLDISFMENVTDEGIKHLKLHTLRTNDNITDDGIKHMNLYELCSNRNITDEGIKYMTNMEDLNIASENVTDKGIENMTNLKYLDEHWSGITDEGLKNIKLLHLHIKSNNITSKGLLHMKDSLKGMYIEYCKKFYAEDILQLKLDYLEVNADDMFVDNVLEHPNMRTYLDNLKEFVCEADWGRN